MKAAGQLVDPREQRRQERRLKALHLISLLMLGTLAVRLWQIQIVQGREYRELAAAQSSRVREILPPRGLLTDRSGVVIVDNQPGMRLRFHPDRAVDVDRTQAFLEQALSHPPRDMASRIRKAMRRRPYRAETIVDQLPRDDLARIAALSYEHPELELQVTPLRRYPHGEVAAHLLGYLGEVNDADLARLSRFDRYQSGDIVGKQGIEREYEPWLFGTKGADRFRVDARGRMIQQMSSVAPRAGWDLRMTIDWPTQKAAEEAMAEYRGTVVALDPRSGDVLAIVSRPAFDPTRFVGGIRTGDWSMLRDDPGHPLEYRPVRGQYPPGSTIKPLTALAALDAGLTTPSESIVCPGYYRLGRRTFRCWKEGGHGRVSLYDAVKYSCDAYFYEMGRRLGIDKLAEYLRRWGFGMPTGIDLEGEKGGLVPDTAWKQRVSQEPWQEGETIITAIGQGSLLVTPIQMAVFYAAMANGGTLVTPHVLKEFANRDRPSPLPSPERRGNRAAMVDAEQLQIVREALIATVMDRDGTGGRSRLPGVQVAGKTGTAQVIAQAKRGEELDAHLKDHAWFVAWAPADNPRIAVSVLVENGGGGGAVAAPVARRVLEAFLRKGSPG
jgi:penicillin-binding protein 2